MLQPVPHESNRKRVLLVGVALIFWGITALAAHFMFPGRGDSTVMYFGLSC